MAIAVEKGLEDVLKSLSTEELLKILAQRQAQEKEQEYARQIQQLSGELDSILQRIEYHKATLRDLAIQKREIERKLRELKGEEKAVEDRAAKAIAVLRGEKVSLSRPRSGGSGNHVRYNKPFRITVDGRPRTKWDSIAWGMLETRDGVSPTQQLYSLFMAQTGYKPFTREHALHGAITAIVDADIAKDGKKHVITIEPIPAGE